MKGAKLGPYEEENRMWATFVPSQDYISSPFLTVGPSGPLFSWAVGQPAWIAAILCRLVLRNLPEVTSNSAATPSPTAFILAPL
jgi:hypothetical protein